MNDPSVIWGKKLEGTHRHSEFRLGVNKSGQGYLIDKNISYPRYSKVSPLHSECDTDETVYMEGHGRVPVLVLETRQGTNQTLQTGERKWKGIGRI